jgi:predicted protein tyrosine phosphatase
MLDELAECEGEVGEERGHVGSTTCGRSRYDRKCRRRVSGDESLFVCSRNRMRSPTAEAVFGGREGVEVLSAGTAPDAETPVSAELIEWVDIVFAMEGVHRKGLMNGFGGLLRDKRVVVLGIRDEYAYMEPVPVELLKSKVASYLPGL